MEKATFNINAVYSSLTKGSVEPITTQTNPPTGPCSFEQLFELSQGAIFICVAAIHGKIFKHYGGCKFENNKCPLNKYTPLEKIDYGDSKSKFEIEDRWKEIKSNNGKQS